MKQVLLLCFTLSYFAVHSQYHTVKLNTTFLFNQNPVGGFGYEYTPDSSSYSYGINFEAGMYGNSSLQTVNTTLEEYTLVGLGLMPEFRRYIAINGWSAPRGLFVTCFTKVRYLHQTVQYGIQSIPGGYQLDSPHTTDELGFAFDGGIGIGFKTGKAVKGLHVEGVLGYALSHSKLYNNSNHREELIRFEISLSGIFERARETDPEFTW